jgi:hypothetical protein
VSWLNPILPWIGDRLASPSRIVIPCCVSLPDITLSLTKMAASVYLNVPSVFTHDE